MAPREFDIVILGATGFTGKLVAQEYCQEPSFHKIALAARNLTKLEEFAKDLSQHFPLIEIDVSNDEALLVLAKRTRLIINCVGPFALYGKPVVNACVQAKTDYVDINGEPAFMSASRREFDESARKNGALIVQACGMDSVPADLGAYRTENILNDPESIDCHVDIADFSISQGTLRTTMVSLKNAAASPRRPSGRPSARLHYDKKDGVWLYPFPVADPSVVRYTHKLLGRDIRYNHYFISKNIFALAYYLILGFIIGILSILVKYKWGEKLFEMINTVFISGPSKKLQAEGRHALKFRGYGRDSEEVSTLFEVPEAYHATAILIKHCSTCILTQRDKLPNGGVMSPIGALRDVLDEQIKGDARFTWKIIT